MSCTDSAVSHIDYDSNYTENKYKKLICQYKKKMKKQDIDFTITCYIKTLLDNAIL